MVQKVRWLMLVVASVVVAAILAYPMGPFDCGPPAREIFISDLGDPHFPNPCKQPAVRRVIVAGAIEVSALAVWLFLKPKSKDA